MNTDSSTVNLQSQAKPTIFENMKKIILVIIDYFVNWLRGRKPGGVKALIAEKKHFASTTTH